MRKGELTRQHIIEKSAPLFNTIGYSASLSELMKATGLEKGGIYRHFASKEELACESFDYAYQMAEKVRFAGLDELGDGLLKIQSFIRNFSQHRSPIPGGCPVYNTAVEHDDGHDVLKQRAQKGFQKWVQRLAAYVDEAKVEGRLKNELDSERLATFIWSVLEGSLIAKNLVNKSHVLSDAATELLDFLDSKRIV